MLALLLPNSFFSPATPAPPSSQVARSVDKGSGTLAGSGGAICDRGLGQSPTLGQATAARIIGIIGIVA